MEFKDFEKVKIAKTDYRISPLLATRWSPRQFSDKAITREQMHQLLEAARWAASSGNGQPWRFMYTFKGTKEYDLLVDHLSDWNKKWVSNAPVLMLTAYKKEFDNGKVNFHAMHDLGLSVGNLTFQAAQMELAVHSMAGVDWKKAHDTYRIPEGYHITTAIAIGYYGGDVSVLPADMQKTEIAERERILQSDFAAEGKWTFV